MKNHTRSYPYYISIFLTALGYLSYFISIVCFLGIIVPVIIVLGFFPKNRRRFARGTLKRYLFFLTRRLLPFLQVYSIDEISGFTPLTSPCIFAANHRGRLDALLLLSILEKTGVLIKSKYCRFALYRMFVKYLDFIAIDPDTPAGIAAAMHRCKELIGLGHNILVFPEGARAASGKLLPFKKFVFRLAIATGLPVIPVIIHSDYPFMAKRPGSIFPKNKLRYTLRCLDPIFNTQGQRSVDFAGAVRKRIAVELTALDKGTVWEI
jgi:1-acyl-sn-glycerol-3-phosphate acyltransferase